MSEDTNHLINPFGERSPYHESNPGPSSYVYNANSYQVPYSMSPLACRVHLTHNKTNPPNTAGSQPTNIFCSAANSETSKNPEGNEFTHLMSKLSFSEDRNKGKEEGIFEWISKVPGRVLGVVPNSTSLEENSKISKIQNPHVNDVKVKNCNLELSQREFDEVLAVLRARTPSGRRRTPVKNLKKKERTEKLEKHNSKLNFEGSDVGSVHESGDVYSYEDCVCTSCKKYNQQARCNSQNSSESYNFPSRHDQEKILGHRGRHVCLRLKNMEDQSKSDIVESVSNKADVLLGAILRTSKDQKGLVDISNGARPRTVLSDLSEKAKHLKETLEEEKSLPSALNKRLIQFKQLFKREERLDILTLGDHSKESLSAEQEQAETEASRRINFLSEDKSAQDFVDCSGTSFTRAHANSKLHSTNRKKEEENEEESQVFDRESSEAITHHKVKAQEQSTKPSEMINSDDNAEDDFVRHRFQQSKTGVLTSEQSDDAMSFNLGYNQSHFEEEDETIEKMVPSALEQKSFRRSLENAASMVFHSRTGLPLTSSPAPLRKGSCFDFDSSLNSVSSKKRYYNYSCE